MNPEKKSFKNQKFKSVHNKENWFLLFKIES